MKVRDQANEVLKNCYAQYSDGLLRYCTLKLGRQEDADDCVQECFFVLYKHLLKGENIQNAGAFLYTTAKNLLKAQWRKDQKARNNLPLDELADSLAAAEESFADAEIDYDRCAAELVSALTAPEQELYRLRYMEQKSLAVISDELGINFYAAAMRLSRVRAKIKELAADWLKEEEFK